MNITRIVTDPHRNNPLYLKAKETIKVNKLNSKKDYENIIKKQVMGIYLFRHILGLNNAILRVKTFKLSKQILNDRRRDNNTN